MTLKTCLLLLGGYSVLAAGAAVPQDDSASEACQYTVKPGDYCYLIATNYRTELEQLVKLNPQLNSECSLHPGDKLNVPCVEPNEVPPKMDGVCTKYYTTEEGDTCYGIATCEGVGPKNIRAWNNLDESCSFEAGRKLCVSRYQPVECEDYHRVKKGDTCESIAESIDKTTAYLVDLNPSLLLPDCFLDVGYKVCIKAAESEPDEKEEAQEAASVASTAAAASSTYVTYTTVPTVVTVSSVPRAFLNGTTTSYVTSTVTKTVAVSAASAVPSNTTTSFPSGVKINISQELKVSIKLAMCRFVGNHTSREPVRDAVVMPPESQIQEMVKEAAKAKADSQNVAPKAGDNAAETATPAPASPASNSVISNQLFKIFASASVSIQNSGCGTGACSVQVSSNAEAGSNSSPAPVAYSAGDDPVAPSVDMIPASAEAESKVGDINRFEEEEEEELEACEAD
ncbi:hypothetical protein CP533_4731 [Ophiocordyceps camponoti-saundersi (nom. inval.)]|nr:hypothetical protein CP533_4731 [Ophiocordyceps camponoti-saundersi (nom. inval.)]